MMDKKTDERLIGTVPEFKTYVMRFREINPKENVFEILKFFVIHAFQKNLDSTVRGPELDDFSGEISRLFAELETLIDIEGQDLIFDIEEHFVKGLFLVTPELFEEIRSYAGPSMKHIFDRRIAEFPDWIRMMKEADEQDLPYEEDQGWEEE